ncbi:MAG: conjugative transposon protein TraM, partial [Flavobacteriaceae bacterium]|nr:conjugative transposon protein TraM [Flavobacteriaceae bacterium]
NNENPTLKTNRIPVPRLKDDQKKYDSKLEAINDLKEVRENNAPSMYDERLLDSLGVYDPELLDKEKMRMVDSIYNEGRINYTEHTFRRPTPKPVVNSGWIKKDSLVLHAKDLDLQKYQSAFFHKSPSDKSGLIKDTDPMIYAVVNRTQVVKKDFRLELRLTQPAVIKGRKLPKHTKLYGFVSFKPNRVLIHITNLEHQEVSLKAFDLQDGNEGIYIPNNFKADASKVIVDDALDQVNIPAVPSVGVLKKVFQRSNRNIKVTITDNYKLILKPKL